jgi:hypothetical protein
LDQVDEIVSQIPIGQLAAQLGIDEESAEEAVRAAVPALLGGMAANAQDPGGASSLERALAAHADDPLDLSAVDVEDGNKIVHHIYGDNTDEVVNRLGGLGGGKGGIMKSLLPLLAPLIMGWLAKRMGGAGQASAPEETGGGLGGMLDSLGGGSAGGGGGDLGDLLDSVGGGGSGGAGGGLGDLLGGMLGGGGGGAGSGLDDLLGGLLGGGTKS